MKADHKGIVLYKKVFRFRASLDELEEIVGILNRGSSKMGSKNVDGLEEDIIKNSMGNYILGVVKKADKGEYDKSENYREIHITAVRREVIERLYKRIRNYFIDNNKLLEEVKNESTSSRN